MVGKPVAPRSAGRTTAPKREIPITPGISPPPFPAFPRAGRGEGRIEPGFKGDVKEGPHFGRKIPPATPPLGGNSNELLEFFPRAPRRKGRGAVEIKGRAERKVFGLSGGGEGRVLWSRAVSWSPEPGVWRLQSVRSGRGSKRSQGARPAEPCLTVGRWRGDIEARPSESPRG